MIAAAKGHVRCCLAHSTHAKGGEDWREITEMVSGRPYRGTRPRYSASGKVTICISIVQAPALRLVIALS